MGVIMKILICDDEKEMSHLLKKKICNINQNTEVLTFNNSFSLYEYLDKNHLDVDAIFMDIEFKTDKLNGMDYCQEIMRICPKVKIIFVSGYADKYIEEIFLTNQKINIFGFLKKPVNTKKLKEYMDKLEETHKQDQKNHFLEFKELKKGIIYINFDDIIYIESEKRHATVYTKTGEHIGLIKLKEIMEQLRKNTNCFYWCNKSDIVNINEIKNIPNSSKCVVLTNNKEIMLSNFENTTISQKRQQIMAIKTSLRGI